MAAWKAQSCGVIRSLILYCWFGWARRLRGRILVLARVFHSQNVHEIITSTVSYLVHIIKPFVIRAQVMKDPFGWVGQKKLWSSVNLRLKRLSQVFVSAKARVFLISEWRMTRQNRLNWPATLLSQNCIRHFYSIGKRFWLPSWKKDWAASCQNALLYQQPLTENNHFRKRVLLVQDAYYCRLSKNIGPYLECTHPVELSTALPTCSF